MIGSLHQYDLMKILSAEKLKDVVGMFGLDKSNELIAASRVRADNIKHHHHRYTRSLMSALMEPPSYLSLTLWCLVGVIAEVGSVGLAAICLGFGAAILGTVGVFAVATFDAVKKEDQKTEDTNLLLALQLECAKALAEKNGITMNTPTGRAPKADNKKLARLKNALEVGLITSAMIFTAYYVTIQSLFVAFGLTALATALAGPVGVCIALAVSFGVAGFFSYKQYQLEKNTWEVKQAQKQLKDEIVEIKNKVSEQCKQTDLQSVGPQFGETGVKGQCHLAPKAGGHFTNPSNQQTRLLA